MQVATEGSHSAFVVLHLSSRRLPYHKDCPQNCGSHSSGATLIYSAGAPGESDNSRSRASGRYGFAHGGHAE